MNNLNIIDDTVTSFVMSKENKHLSTKRVLFHIDERMRSYDISSSRTIQNILSPVSLALCPTSKCIRDCVFCSNSQRNAINRKVNAEYSREMFSSLANDINALQVKGVTFAGGGEPLTYDKEALENFMLQDNISYKIGIHTNGIYLSKLISDSIFTKGNIKYINISAVAHTHALYHEITGANGNQLFEIENNIIKALQLKGLTSSGVSIGVKHLICRNNYMYTSDAYNYYSSLDVDSILLRCVGNFEPGQDVELSQSQNQELLTILSNKLHLPEEQIQAIIGKPSVTPPLPSRCWILALQYTAGIDPDGETYLCSPWSQREYSIGNSSKSSLKEIWGSQKHREIADVLNRKMLNNECNPLLCRHFYSNLAIDAYVEGSLEALPASKMEEMYGRFI